VPGLHHFSSREDGFRTAADLACPASIPPLSLTESWLSFGDSPNRWITSSYHYHKVGHVTQIWPTKIQHQPIGWYEVGMWTNWTSHVNIRTLDSPGMMGCLGSLYVWGQTKQGVTLPSGENAGMGQREGAGQRMEYLDPAVLEGRHSTSLRPLELDFWYSMGLHMVPTSSALSSLSAQLFLHILVWLLPMTIAPIQDHKV
jgi:hypothetical protein